MTKVVLVCVAGVSGTFLARRMRDLEPRLSIAVTTVAALPEVAGGADAVLVAPQLVDGLDAVRRITAETPLTVLPASAYGVAGAGAAVRALHELLGTADAGERDHTLSGKKENSA